MLRAFTELAGWSQEVGLPSLMRRDSRSRHSRIQQYANGDYFDVL
jgi:hypothetical protein